MNKKICLVTEELSGLLGSGGIGAAFHELAVLLADNGFFVDILYCPNSIFSDNDSIKIVEYYLNLGIRLDLLNIEEYVNGNEIQKKSYAIYKTLIDRPEYSFVHFHDYKGLGFFCFSAKKQGLSFIDTQLVLQMHGPTRWTLEANNQFFTHEEQLIIDFMERECTKKADRIVSPSHYLLDWLVERNFIDDNEKKCSVIKNACSELSRRYTNKLNNKNSSNELINIKEIIFLGRHEKRKGIKEFCDTLDILNDELATSNIKVTVLGKYCVIDGMHSGAYLVERAKKWSFNIQLHTGLDRNGVASYLKNAHSALVLICSKFENSPYSILEAALLRKPIICSKKGGGSEILGGKSKKWHLIEINKNELSEKIRIAVKNGAPIAKLSDSPDKISERWIAFHENSLPEPKSKGMRPQPKVTFGITHYERPSKLTDAILSAIRQTYANLEIIVIDDGSIKLETLEALSEIEKLLIRVGGRLIRQDNAYLGAARNAIINNSESEYIVFLDDDDIAFPDLVENLVIAIESSGADAVTCLNIYMPETMRDTGITRPESFCGKPSYIPIGGPLSVALINNTLGAATSIFRRSSLIEVGAYSELMGVGHEDYELYLRMIQNNKHIEVCPIPLYLYETERVSMLSSTSITDNYQRNFNALNFNCNTQSWSDFISLNIGKNTQINTINRTDWLYSQIIKSDNMIKINRGHFSSETELNNLLFELAEELKSYSIISSFQSQLNKGEKEFKRIPSKIINKVKFESIEPTKFISIKINLALSRINTAVDEFIKIISDSKIIDEPILKLFLIIMRDLIKVKDIYLIIELISSLEAAEVDNDFFDDIKIIIIILKSVVDDKYDSKIDIANLIKEDEDEYIKKYPDISNSIINGYFKSSFMHYINHGQMELREGFSRSKKLINILSLYSNSKITLRNLLNFFNDDGDLKNLCFKSINNMS